MGKLKDKYGPQGFEIVGVAIDDRETLEKYLEKKPLAWPNILDSDALVSDKLKVTAYPTYFLIDRKGEHVATPYEAGEIEAALLPLLETAGEEPEG